MGSVRVYMLLPGIEFSSLLHIIDAADKGIQYDKINVTVVIFQKFYKLFLTSEFRFFSIFISEDICCLF